MKLHQITLIICGVLMAAVCLGAGWFLVTSMKAKSDAADERNQAHEQLQGIYHAKVFPSQENIARVSEDRKALEAWLVTASNLVHKGDLQVEPKTPTSFKQALQATVRALSTHPGTVQGKVVAAGFNFGFDKYLGQSDSLPVPEHVDRLTGQLAIIERICKELYGANILELKTVTREIFDEKGGAAVQTQEEPSGGSSRRRRRRDDSGESAAPAVKAGARSEFFSSQRFSFEFQARPAAFIAALNKLAAMDLFVVVAEAELRKTSDPLAQLSAKKKESAAGTGATGQGAAAAPIDPATLTHVERIVTDPELEPPVNVKLDIDVYSFEGV